MHPSVSDSECGSQEKNVPCSHSGQVSMCSIILLPVTGTAEELHAWVDKRCGGGMAPLESRMMSVLKDFLF